MAPKRFRDGDATRRGGVASGFVGFLDKAKTFSSGASAANVTATCMPFGLGGGINIELELERSPFAPRRGPHMLCQRTITSWLACACVLVSTACKPDTGGEPTTDADPGPTGSGETTTASTEPGGTSADDGDTMGPHATDAGGTDSGGTDPGGAGSVGTDSGGADSGDTGPGNGSSGPKSGDSGTGDDGSETSTGAGANSPPVVVSATVTPSTLQGSGTVLLVVVATDPDGIDDLIGGTVETPAGGSYGVLATQAQEGAYSMSIDWDDFHAMEPIDIDEGGIESRELIVVLFDQAGASVEHTLNVDLEPADDDLAVCDGASVSLYSDEHCGACGHSCLDALGSTFGFGTCYDGVCEKPGFVAIDDPFTTCSQACAAGAGPQADASGVDGCSLVDAIACPAPIVGQALACPSMSLTNLPPPPCTADASTVLYCDCWAVYDPNAP